MNFTLESIVHNINQLQDQARKLYRDGVSIVSAVNTVTSNLDLDVAQRKEVKRELLSKFGRSGGKAKKYKTTQEEARFDLPVSEEDYAALLRTIPRGVLRRKSWVRQFLGDPIWIEEQVAANYHICPVD